MEQPLVVNAENSRAKVQNVGGDSSAEKHSRSTGNHRFAHQQVGVGRCGCWIGQFQVWRVVERRAVGSEIDGRMLHLHPRASC